MVRRPLLALSVLSALAAPAVTVVAQAQTTSTTSATRPALLPQVRALQLRSLVRAGLSSQAVTAAASAGSLLQRAADMNNDGVDEVLDSRYHAAGQGGERLVLFCRDGKSGAVRWRKIVSPQTGHTYVASPELIGPKALPGVVIVDIGTTEANKTLTISLRLLALDDTGVKFWSHSESGTLNLTTKEEHHVPVTAGLDTFLSKSPDWLIARYDSPGGDGARVTMTPVRVLGRDGTPVVVGHAPSSTVGTPTVIAVPDLNGDSLPDLIETDPGNSAGGGVTAVAGDGSQIWYQPQAAIVNDGGYSLAVGDVNPSPSGSPAASDIAVNSGTPQGGGLGLPLPIPDPTAPSDHGNVTLLDGATGGLVWDQSGDFAFPVLKAGKPLKPAVGVVTTDTTSDSTSTTATTTLVTYDDSGKQIYSVSWKATTKTSSSGASAALAIVAPVGDFEPDGSTDGLALVDVSSGDNAAMFQTLFHGADGTALKSGGAEPLGDSTTATGEDLAKVKAHRGLIVSIYTATSNALLFRTTVAHTRGVTAGAALGAQLHSSSTCADVLVAGQGAKHSIAAVLTAKGALEWVVRFVPGDKSPGTVFHPTTKPHIPACS